MSEVPPDASGGEPADEAEEKMTTGGPAPEGKDAPGAAEAQPGQSAPSEWWLRDPEPPKAPQQTPPSGTPPSGTPPFGTPPFGTPPFGTPPWGAPPWGTPQYGPQAAGGSPPSSPPPYGTPPPGAPPWSAPGWGVPPWAGAPQWYGYGWGPGWSGGPPQPPGGSSFSRSDGSRPIPWLIVGGILAMVAFIALGLGIGYSVWSSSAPAGAQSGATVPGGGSKPLPRLNPSTGRGGFLGVEITSAGVTPTGTSSSTVPSTAGAHVVGVVKSSPAAKAGIVKGDTITEFDTKTVSSALALRVDVLRLAPGTHVKVGWVTSTGKHESATVTLASRPATRAIG